MLSTVSTNSKQKTGLDGRFHFVYKTTNSINGRFYVGKHSSDTLDDGYLGSGKILKQAINKYGRENFTREIISFEDTSDSAYEKEAEFIAGLTSTRSDMYNVSDGGTGARGVKRSDESIQKLKESLRTSDSFQRHLSKLKESRIGSHHTDATKKKISQSNTGKTRSEETKLKQSELKRGKPQSIVTCPVCFKTGGITAMHRFHFDNCGKKTTRTVSKIECPHCGKIGNSNIMKRHHFDNCKWKV